MFFILNVPSAFYEQSLPQIRVGLFQYPTHSMLARKPKKVLNDLLVPKGTVQTHNVLENSVGSGFNNTNRLHYCVFLCLNPQIEGVREDDGDPGNK